MSLISIVIPIHNEAENLASLQGRLSKIQSMTDNQFELIYVDDGSKDNSLIKLTELQQTHKNIRIIKLTRNFGHQAALLAGLRNASGDCVITLDADLQHPPEIIPDLLKHWRDGAQIVNTRRIEKQRLSSKSLTSRWFYRLFSAFSGISIDQGMADFRLLDRQVVNTLSNTDEHALFLRGILQWMGFQQSIIDYTADKRLHGKSKYSFTKMISLALDGITSFSIIPLRLATLLGFFFSVVSFTYLAFALYGWWFTESNIVGWTSVIGSVLFLGGIQLICLGIIGEYIGKIYKEVKHRPHYIIDKRIGFKHV